MKKNSRKLALEWWRELSFDKQKKLMITAQRERQTGKMILQY